MLRLGLLLFVSVVAACSAAQTPEPVIDPGPPPVRLWDAVGVADAYIEGESEIRLPERVLTYPSEAARARDAAAELQKIIDWSPASPEGKLALLSLASVKLSQAEHGAAAELFETFLERSKGGGPFRAFVLENLGYCQEGLGRYDAALDQFGGLEVEGRPRVALYHQARMYEKLGDSAAALAIYREMGAELEKESDAGPGVRYVRDRVDARLSFLDPELSLKRRARRPRGATWLELLSGRPREEPADDSGPKNDKEQLSPVTEAILERPYARVYGRDIGDDDVGWVQRALIHRRNLSTQYRDEGLVADIVEGAIERELLLRAARELELEVSGESAGEAFLAGQVFFSYPSNAVLPLMSPLFVEFRDGDGAFQEQEYRDFLFNQLQLSKRAFAEVQRAELVVERFRNLIELTAQVSEDELWTEYRYSEDRVELRYVRLSPTFFGRAMRVTPAEIQAWANEHESEIRQRYAAERFRYVNTRRQVRALHIVIDLPAGVSEQESGARLARARAVRTLAVAQGADFGLLARCFSDSSEGRLTSGDLGHVRRGMTRLGPEVEGALFALDEGDVSEVVETLRGYHILRVLEGREGDIAYEEASPTIAEQLMRRAHGEARAEAVAHEIHQRLLRDDPFDQTLFVGMAELRPDACPVLDGVSQDLGAGAGEPAALEPTIQLTGLFGRDRAGGPGIGRESEVLAGAFGLTEEQPTAAAVAPVRGGFMVYQLARSEAASRASFARQRIQLERRLLYERRVEALRFFVGNRRAEAEAAGAIQSDWPIQRPPGASR